VEKTRQEDVCAAVAASVLAARFRRRDTNAGSQVHDLDLEFADGSVEALEVCSFTDATVREQWVALSGIDEVSSALGGSWTVCVPPTVQR
jgi:hypothetical protein